MTYSEAVKSPRSLNLQLKKGGLKIQGSPDKGQVTLKASFEAGKLISEAKKLKRKVLMDKEVIEVSTRMNFDVQNF